MKILLFFLTFLGALMANSLPQHVTKTLENGLQIVVIPMNNKSDVITTDIFYKVGSGNEIMGKSGIAHMLEHLNFKSTKNLKAGEFDEIVKGFGGVNNASTGFDYTHYFIKSSSKNLSKSLELFAELMQNLRLTDEEFQPERNVVLEERLWRTDNSPIGYLYFRLLIMHLRIILIIGRLLVLKTILKIGALKIFVAFTQNFISPLMPLSLLLGILHQKLSLVMLKNILQKLKIAHHFLRLIIK